MRVNGMAKIDGWFLRDRPRTSPQVRFLVTLWPSELLRSQRFKQRRLPLRDSRGRMIIHGFVMQPRAAGRWGLAVNEGALGGSFC